MVFMKMKKLLAAMAAAVMSVSVLPAAEICAYSQYAGVLSVQGDMTCFDSIDNLSWYLYENDGGVTVSDIYSDESVFLENVESLWMPSGFSDYTDSIARIGFTAEYDTVLFEMGSTVYEFFRFRDDTVGRERYNAVRKNGDSKKVNGRTVYRKYTNSGDVYSWKQSGRYFVLTVNGGYESYALCTAEEYVIPEYTQEGLRNIGGSLYYVQSDGSWYVGWKTINGKKYFFGMDGAALTKNTIVGNVRYTFNSRGECTGTYTGWLLRNGYKYYYKNGRYVTGVNNISGKTYTFSDNGILIY